MSETHWENFGAWLQREREKAEVSQSRLAKKIDIHVVQISRIENGKSGAKRETVIALIEGINALSSKHRIDLKDGLNRAGFTLDSPMTPKEFFKALAKLDVKEVAFEDGVLDQLSDQDFRDLLEIVEANISVKLKQFERRRLQEISQ